MAINPNWFGSAGVGGRGRILLFVVTVYKKRNFLTYNWYSAGWLWKRYVGPFRRWMGKVTPKRHLS